MKVAKTLDIKGFILTIHFSINNQKLAISSLIQVYLSNNNQCGSICITIYETLIRLYNYTQHKNKKLSKHVIFMADSSKLFSLFATIIILLGKREVYSEVERVGAIGFTSIVVTIAIYGLGMLLVESSLISEGSYMPKDNQESELIKSFR